MFKCIHSHACVHAMLVWGIQCHYAEAALSYAVLVFGGRLGIVGRPPPVDIGNHVVCCKGPLVNISFGGNTSHMPPWLGAELSIVTSSASIC